MSHHHHEDCTGEDCLRCQREIDAAYDPDPGADSDWQIGQDRYEAAL